MAVFPRPWSRNLRFLTLRNFFSIYYALRVRCTPIASIKRYRKVATPLVDSRFRYWMGDYANTVYRDACCYDHNVTERNVTLFESEDAVFGVVTHRTCIYLLSYLLTYRSFYILLSCFLNLWDYYFVYLFLFFTISRV